MNLITDRSISVINMNDEREYVSLKDILTSDNYKSISVSFDQIEIGIFLNLIVATQIIFLPKNEEEWSKYYENPMLGNYFDMKIKPYVNWYEDEQFMQFKDLPNLESKSIASLPQEMPGASSSNFIKKLENIDCLCGTCSGGAMLHNSIRGSRINKYDKKITLNSNSTFSLFFSYEENLRKTIWRNVFSKIVFSKYNDSFFGKPNWITKKVVKDKEPKDWPFIQAVLHNNIMTKLVARDKNDTCSCCGYEGKVFDSIIREPNIIGYKNNWNKLPYAFLKITRDKKKNEEKQNYYSLDTQNMFGDLLCLKYENSVRIPNKNYEVTIREPYSTSKYLPNKENLIIRTGKLNSKGISFEDDYTSIAFISDIVQMKYRIFLNEIVKKMIQIENVFRTNDNAKKLFFSKVIPKIKEFVAINKETKEIAKVVKDLKIEIKNSGINVLNHYYTHMKYSKPEEFYFLKRMITKEI